MEKLNEVEYKKKIEKAKKEVLTCANKNCKLVVKNYKQVLNQLNKDLQKLWKNYETNKIKEKQLLGSLLNLLNKNIETVQYTKFIKCLLKNCYKNYKHYIDLGFVAMKSPFVQTIALMKAKEYNIEPEIRNFFNAMKFDKPTFQKLKILQKTSMDVIRKVYNSNEPLIIKMVKENKNEIAKNLKKIKLL